MCAALHLIWQFVKLGLVTILQLLHICNEKSEHQARPVLQQFLLGSSARVLTDVYTRLIDCLGLTDRAVLHTFLHDKERNTISYAGSTADANISGEGFELLTARVPIFVVAFGDAAGDGSGHFVIADPDPSAGQPDPSPLSLSLSPSLSHRKGVSLWTGYVVAGGDSK